MNRNKVAIALAGGLVAMSLAGAVYAQVMPHGPSLADVEARAMAQLDRMDVNLDGQIDTADRADANRAAFDAADRNNDGTLGFEEFASLRDQAQMRGPGMRGEGRPGEGRPGEGRRGGMGGMLPALITADTNRDRVVTQAEYNAAITGFYQSADTNGDNVLTREEALARRNAMRTQAQARMRAAPPAAPAAPATGGQ